MQPTHLHCPHCNKRNFFVPAEINNKYTPPQDEWRWEVAFCCNCRNTILIRLDAEYEKIRVAGTVVENKVFRIGEIFPNVKRNDCPDDCPHEVSERFIKAEKLLNTYDIQDAEGAGMHLRKCLEFAFKKTLDPAETKGMLKERIDKAAKKGLIPPSITEWSHHVRDVGNEAVHDEITMEEARELLAFTEMLLRCLFTIPAMVERRKQDVAAAKQATQQAQPTTP